MLIKYYGLKFPHALSILDEVTDVVVLGGIFTITKNDISAGPDSHEIKNHYIHDKDEDIFPKHFQAAKDVGFPEIDTRHVQYVDFTRNGLRCRLSVFGHAYICNNEGKTIQKVDPANTPGR